MSFNVIVKKIVLKYINAFRRYRPVSNCRGVLLRSWGQSWIQIQTQSQPGSVVLVQGDQLNMVVLFRYLVKCDPSSVHYCTVTYSSVTFYKVPEKHGHV